MYVEKQLGQISKKGRLFLGKLVGPKESRRARKPLQDDWITGKRPNRHFANKRRNRRTFNNKSSSRSY